MLDAVEDDLNQAVMRVFLNLTQGDANVSQMLSRKTNFVKTILTCAFFCVGSEHQGQAQVDVSMLSVGLLVNLLEYCPALKISIGSMGASQLVFLL